jgi:hypothetical protein
MNHMFAPAMDSEERFDMRNGGKHSFEVKAGTSRHWWIPSPDVHVTDRLPCLFAVRDGHVLELEGQLQLVQELQRAPCVSALCTYKLRKQKKK